MYSFTCILPLPKYNGETRPNPKWSYFRFAHHTPETRLLDRQVVGSFGVVWSKLMSIRI